MNHLDILLPFGLPQTELARDLLRQCQAPALATLLAREKRADQSRACDPFSRALPHEHWLSQYFKLNASQATDSAQDPRGNSPPAAIALLRGHDEALRQGHWFILQPAHTHVARDHLVLTDIAQLALDEADARRLFASALPLFAEVGRTLIYLDASTWLMRADDWAGLHTSTPQAASGRNIDIWMPAGPGELAWRKLQNEVQMQWFYESLNEERERRGQQAVNSLWLWGGGDAANAIATNHYSHGFKLHGWPQALSTNNQDASNAAEVLAGSGERGLLLLDTLLEAGLSQEWGIWLERLETLERDWFAPLLQALREQQLGSLSLIMSGQDRLLEVALSKSALRKFWVRPGLSRLASINRRSPA